MANPDPPPNWSQCTTCGGQLVATGRCNDCKKDMCEGCRSSTHNTSEARKHKIVDLDIKCNCSDKVQMRHGRWRNGANKNRKYFECEKPRSRPGQAPDGQGHCGFFKWAEAAISTEESEIRENQRNGAKASFSGQRGKEKGAMAAGKPPPIQCTTCRPQLVATAHCRDCNKNMCEDCRLSHNTKARDHQVVDLAIKCDCQTKVEMRYGKWKNGTNKNRKYFECEKAKGDGHCGFFKWAEAPLNPAETEDREEELRQRQEEMDTESLSATMKKMARI